MANRRLSTRRGSTTASDLYGTHSRPDLHSTSRLTIVRVPSDPPPPPGRINRRLPSPAQDSRLSFAFSSFGPGNAAGGPARANSPSASPRLRPSSHVGPRLSPDQLLDLARSATSPTHALQPPVRSRPSSPSNTRSQSPTHLPSHVPSTAATFTPLPDSIQLPFIDRPSEVAALISSPPSAKLFSLLAQTFPPQDTQDLSDPTKWSYQQLHNHLAQTTRQQIPDEFWVLQARKAILSHSELIWERVKGALGIPPELDVDYDHTIPFYFGGHLLDHLSSALSDGSVDTDDIPDDYGRSARGHWEDWDAVMDSPVYDRSSIPASPLFSATTKHGDHHPDDASFFTFPPGGPNFSDATQFLSIEPLLSSSSQPPSIAASEIATGVLGDIQEGAEDEEEPLSAATEQLQKADAHDPDLISPLQIQGLRISTIKTDPHPPLPSILNVSSSALNQPYTPPPPVSPLPPYPSQPRSRTASGSFSHGMFKRTGSFGSLGSLNRGEIDESSSESGREHRAPLFPSSFATLNAGPTLGSDPAGIAGRKRRTSSHSSLGGIVSGYRRLSWGTPPPGA